MWFGLSEKKIWCSFNTCKLHIASIKLIMTQLLHIKLLFFFNVCSPDSVMLKENVKSSTSYLLGYQTCCWKTFFFS